jgi:hypothetical protein
MQDIEKEQLSLEAIENALRSILEDKDLDIGVPELIEIGAALSIGENLYKANIGTREHPCWIIGSKDSVQKRIGQCQRELLAKIKQT